MVGVRLLSFTAVVGGVALVAIVSKVYNAYLYSFGGYMEEDKSFTFKMPASVFMDLQEIADAHDLSLAQVVRKALREFLTHQHKGDSK